MLSHITNTKPADVRLENDIFDVRNINGREYADREEMPLDGYPRFMDSWLFRCHYSIKVRLMVLLEDASSASLMAAMHAHIVTPCSNLELEYWEKSFQGFDCSVPVASVGTILLKDHRLPGVLKVQGRGGGHSLKWLQVPELANGDYYRDRFWEAGTRFIVMTESPTPQPLVHSC